MVKVTTRSQFEKFVERMKEYPNLATAVIPTGENKIYTRNLWVKISKDLNRLGPPTRDVEGWKKVWSDFKTKLKKKIACNKLKIKSETGGPSSSKPLSYSRIEVIAMEILNLNPDSTEAILFDGSCSASCASELTTEPYDEIVPKCELLDEDDDQPAVEEPTPSYVPKKKVTTSNKKYRLLQRQLKIQENLCYELKTQMENMNNNSIASLRYQKKMYTLKLKKFKMFQARIQEKQQQDIEVNKVKLKLMEIIDII